MKVRFEYIHMDPKKCSWKEAKVRPLNEILNSKAPVMDAPTTDNLKLEDYEKVVELRSLERLLNVIGSDVPNEMESFEDIQGDGEAKTQQAGGVQKDLDAEVIDDANSKGKRIIRFNGPRLIAVSMFLLIFVAMRLFWRVRINIPTE